MDYVALSERKSCHAPFYYDVHSSAQIHTNRHHAHSSQEHKRERDRRRLGWSLGRRRRRQALAIFAVGALCTRDRAREIFAEFRHVPRDTHRKIDIGICHIRKVGREFRSEFICAVRDKVALCDAIAISIGRQRCRIRNDSLPRRRDRATVDRARRRRHRRWGRDD